MLDVTTLVNNTTYSTKQLTFDVVSFSEYINSRLIHSQLNILPNFPIILIVYRVNYILLPLNLQFKRYPNSRNILSLVLFSFIKHIKSGFSK